MLLRACLLNANWFHLKCHAVGVMLYGLYSTQVAWDCLPDCIVFYVLLRSLIESFLWHRNLADSQRSYHHCRDWIWCPWAGMGHCSDGMGVWSTGAAHVSAFSFLACKIAIGPHLALGSSTVEWLFSKQSSCLFHQPDPTLVRNVVTFYAGQHSVFKPTSACSTCSDQKLHIAACLGVLMRSCRVGLAWSQCTQPAFCQKHTGVEMSLLALVILPTCMQSEHTSVSTAMIQGYL